MDCEFDANQQFVYIYINTVVQKKIEKNLKNKYK